MSVMTFLVGVAVGVVAHIPIVAGVKWVWAKVRAWVAKKTEGVW